MKTYLLFGIDGTDLRAARSSVERALGIQLVLHESEYRCGDYYRCGDVGSEHFILQRNFDQAEGEWTKPRCKEFGLLLYANKTDRGEAVCAALSAFAKLVSRERAVTSEQGDG